MAGAMGPQLLSRDAEAGGASRERTCARARHLVICVDGLPYSVLEQMATRSALPPVVRAADAMALIAAR
jgi:hypothetical protein